MVKTIEIIGSRCRKTGAYAALVERVARELGMPAAIETIVVMPGCGEDDKRLQDWGLRSRCQVAYCPGCDNLITPEGNTHRFLPALRADGQLLLHSRLPHKEQVEQALRALL